MKAYVYDIKTKIIDLKFNEVIECGKDFIKGLNDLGEKRSVDGINLNQMNYIVIDKDLQEGQIVDLNKTEDKRNDLLSQEDKIKLLEKKLEKLTKILENK